MGFTVVGPDRFLGSGRPDAAGFRQGKPARLGLIESTDAGDSWASRSLSGEVDFHALASSQGTTYDWDAGTGRLLASTDNVTWETRSTLKLSGFAVDPARVDSLVAASAEGRRMLGTRVAATPVRGRARSGGDEGPSSPGGPASALAS